MKRNIVLIGPPGVGKSTVGVLLAKHLSMPFIDSDVAIQAAEGSRLQDILDSVGVDGFRRIEEKHILELDTSGSVIATGGSVVYSERAMEHLEENGIAVFLDLPCESLMKRISNLDSRGVVKPSWMSFCELYDERLPLYQRYADYIIDCSGLTHDEVVLAITSALEGEGCIG